MKLTERLKKISSNLLLYTIRTNETEEISVILSEMCDISSWNRNAKKNKKRTKKKYEYL